MLSGLAACTLTAAAAVPERARRGPRRRTASSPPGRTFTVDAGARLMGAGGNAIDGGVASIFAAAVVEISHFGLGGEAPIIIYSARDKRVVVINGQGSAPEGGDARDCSPGRTRFPGNGPLGATLPAAVDSAALALAKYGTKSLSEVLQPAIALADGFPMYEFLHRYLADRAQGLRAVRLDDADLLSRRARSRRSARCSASRISRRRCGRWRRRSRRRWRAGRRASRRSKPGATRSTKDRSRAT